MRIDMSMFMFRGLVLYNVVFIFVSSGVLGSPSFLLPYFMITLTLHNAIILIITIP